ncbi:hypothetical protein EPO33_00105 [Patescibacteria group bacterium]|nr:MAG: hypothetical protein EPO33_00105 [Patescibacteria group bacterium]
MTRIRIVPVVLALLLIGAGCSLRPAPVTPPAPDERTVREAPPAATSTPEAPPIREPEMVATLPPLVDWPVWRGTWFDVKYPPGFAARVGAEDSAFFTSPDGKVEFYVYSPLWGGDAAADVGLNSATERLVDEKTQVDGPTTTHWVTIAAKDGSYTRSWVDIKDDNFGSPVNHAFGIKYKDAAAYAGWRDAYLAFKASLVQYAD